MKTTTHFFVERLGIEVEVTGYGSPFRKGRMFLANGDPGYPDEGGEIEDVECDVELTDAEMNLAFEALRESAMNDDLYEGMSNIFE